MPRWWDHLSDDELRVRLAAANLAGEAVDALVRDRDDEDAQAAVSAALGSA